MADIQAHYEPMTIELHDNKGGVTEIDLTGPATLDAGLLASWLDKKSPNTQRAYILNIARFYAYCGVPVRQVDVEMIQGYLHTLEHQKDSTQARATAAVKSLLSYASKTGVIAFNPGAVIKLPEIEDTLAERIMSKEEAGRILANEQNPRNRVIISLLYHAGLRVSEICNLQWRNLQPREESGQVTIFGKGRKTRHIVLKLETWRDVQMLRLDNVTPHDYVFCSQQRRDRKGKPRKPRLDESTVYDIVEVAGVRARIALYTEMKDGKQVTRSRVSPHWLRHAHATHSIQNGAPLTLVKDTLGHKSIQTTTKYVHVMPDDSSSLYI